MRAFDVAIFSKQTQGEQISVGDYAIMCSLEISGHPKAIALRVQAKGDRVSPIAIQEGVPHEYPGQLAFNLTVPVDWRQQDSILIPHTRRDEWDFVNVLLIDPQLHLMDVQVSLLTRKGQFYIMAQLVYEGWMRIAEDDEVQFIPGASAFAYPGANYSDIWKGRGGILATIARVVHDVLDTVGFGLDEVTAAKWEPREVVALDGWKLGHVLFFCPITNTGRILGEDGVLYHVWGNNLVNVEGPVHMLEPMAPVYFRPGVQKKGQAFTPVRSCKPT